MSFGQGSRPKAGSVLAITRASVAAAILALTPAALGADGGRGFAELRLQGYSGVEGEPVQTILRFRPELIPRAATDTLRVGPRPAPP